MCEEMVFPIAVGSITLLSLEIVSLVIVHFLGRTKRWAALGAILVNAIGFLFSYAAAAFMASQRPCVEANIIGTLVAQTLLFAVALGLAYVRQPFYK